MCDFRSVVVASGSVLAVSSTLVFRGARFAIRDYCGDVASVCFRIRAIIRSSPAKAREQDSFHTKDQRIRAYRISHMDVESGDISMDICVLIIPI